MAKPFLIFDLDDTLFDSRISGIKGVFGSATP